MNLTDLEGKTIQSISKGQGSWNEWLTVIFTDGTNIRIFGESGCSAGIIDVKGLGGEPRYTHCEYDEEGDRYYNVEYEVDEYED